MFSFEWRRETKLVFKCGMCDHRSGCCGCFIPYFPYRQFFEQVETSEMLFDLPNISVYTNHVAVVHFFSGLFLRQGEAENFHLAWNGLTVNWLSTNKALWVFCISFISFFFFWNSNFHHCVKASFLFLSWVIFPSSLPFWLNGTISTFQTVQISRCPFFSWTYKAQCFCCCEEETGMTTDYQVSRVSLRFKGFFLRPCRC